MESTLVLQRSVIRAELAALDIARSNLPTVERRNWIGDARAFYVLSLVRLHSDVDSALDRLRTALVETSQALDTLAR